jgi:hypothetical protein
MDPKVIDIYTNGTRRHWSVVIFACRESLPQLLQTLDAARLSAASCAVIQVLVNGNPALANELAVELNRQQASADQAVTNPAVQLWSIPTGDKANAWNQYIHQLWAGEEIAFFIDGYVRLNPDAVELLGHALAANAQALGGSGVPTMGRSSKALRENIIAESGFHGNLCCIKDEAIRQMRDRQIRLPVGLYRTDGLMRAILVYAFDPGSQVWDESRIQVHPQASWQIDPAHWWRIRDVRAFFKRYVRQVRGKLENAAIFDHLARRLRSPADLPSTAQELVLEWVERCPSDYLRLARKHFLARHTLKSFRDAAVPSNEAVKPRLVWPS